MKQNLALVILLLACLPVCANDTLATLAAGGLVPVKSTEIVLQSEDLDISVHEIKVRYSFWNTADHDIEAFVAFPLPEINGANLFWVPTLIPFRDRTNFVNFQVDQLWPIAGSASTSWQRKPIATETDLRAFHDDKDITDTLTRLGLPISVLDPHMDSAIMALPQPTRELLANDELIVMSERAGPDKTKRQTYFPWWSNRVQFDWKQAFPAHTVTVLEQTYAPVVGGGYIVKDGGETTDLAPFCVSPKQRESITQQLASSPATHDGRPILLEREIKYILTTANNWSGPIRQFNLSIRTNSPQDVLVTCMQGLAQVGPTEYRLTRSDFRPDRELDLIIVQKKQ